MLLKNKIFLWLLIFLPAKLIWGQSSVTATISSSVKAQINSVYKLRHSGDCYWLPQPDQYKDLGSKTLYNSKNTHHLTSSNQVEWVTVLTEPYQATIRKTELTANINDKKSESLIELILKDRFTSDLGMVNKDKCSHTNAMAYTSDPAIDASIEIQYKMPAHTWLVKITVEENTGLFSKALSDIDYLLKPSLKINPSEINFLMNPYREELIWSPPGEIVKIRYHAKSFQSGADLGHLKIKISPLGLDSSIESLKTFLDQLLKNQDLSSIKFDTMLAETMRLNSMPAEVRSITKKFSLYDIKKISDIFWHYAMQNFTDQIRGLDIKNAAALAALNFAHIFLEEVDVYCSNITYQTPLTDHKQNINLMHAIGFWLNRIYLYTETYSYEPFIVFFQEMDKIQKRGLSPDQVTADPILRNQVQDSYLLLREELVARGSLFNRTHTDIVRILKHQTDNRILGKKQDELVNILKVGLDLEQRFGQKFFSYIRNFNGKNSNKINYAEFFSDIKKLEQLQSQASVLLKTNVFQVPDNSNNISAPGLEDIIGELLRNQIAVLFDPVPFKNNTTLEPLRLAFINYNKLEPQKFQNSCLLQ